MSTKWLASAWPAGPWRHWLVYHGSLTRRLQGLCSAFRVRRLRQTLGRPHLDETELLGLTRPRRALIREVLLADAETPLVFAHSVIPMESLKGPWTSLAGLGNRPLGAALFGNPRVGRHALEFRRVDRRHPLYREAVRHLEAPPSALWARRSRFTLDGHPLLVTEVFLPATLRL